MTASFQRRPSPVPEHPLVADATARAVLRAIVDCDGAGFAILRGPLRLHVVASSAYLRMMGMPSALGASLFDIVPPDAAPHHVVLGVVTTGRSATVGPVLVRRRARADGRYPAVSFTYMLAADDGRDTLVLLTTESKS
jgi:hypothetical protein